MKCSRKDITDLTTQLSITVEKSDYETEFIEELKKHKSKSHLKGFRKGKTPMSSLIKMYGNGVLVDLVNKKLQQRLFEFIGEEKLKTLGEPIPSLDHPELDLNAKDLADYEFRFDVGLMPELKVQGLDANYDTMKIELSDAELAEELLNVRKRMGKQVDVESDINENDIIMIGAKELDGDTLKENGWETGFNILVKDIADDQTKEALIGKSLGYEFSFDIHKMEKNSKEEYVRKYLLNIGDDEKDVEVGNIFQGKVEKIIRAEPAELNEEFFTKAFPKDEVKDEQGAKEKLKELIGKQNEQYEKNYSRRVLVETLVDQNKFDLPDEFLKRWLVASNQNITQDDIDKNYDQYVKDIKWSVIRNEIVEEKKITPEENEFQDWQKDRIVKYLEAQGMPAGVDIDSIVQQSLKDPKTANQAYQEFITEKIFGVIEEGVKYKTKKVTREEFFEKLKELNEQKS